MATQFRVDGKPYAEFEAALDYLDPLEGGFSDHAADKGGATKWGISLRFLNLVAEGDVNGDGHVDVKDIHAMTPTHRTFFYEKYFWEHYKLFNVRSQPIANRLFSIYVHMRSKDAGLVVQRACRSVQKVLKIDGMVGAKTFTCINSANDFELLAAIRSEQAAVYEKIVLKNPDQAVYLDGWLNRAYLL